MYIVKTDMTCCRHAALTLQQALNETDWSWPSKDARALLTDSGETRLAGDVSTGSLIIEHLNKRHQADACIRTMTDLPEVNCHSIIVIVTYFALKFLQHCKIKTRNNRSVKELPVTR